MIEFGFSYTVFSSIVFPDTAFSDTAFSDTASWARGAGGLRMDQGERAYHAIRDAIAAGRYPPGARLVEASIAAREGVTPTPVRQALR